jgi:hypothetical protein
MSALPASAASVSPTPVTSKVTRTVVYGKASGSSTIQGNKNALLSASTRTGNWTNKASFGLKLSKTDSAIRGIYGKLIADTSYLAYVTKPGGKQTAYVAAIGSQAQTARTKGSLSTSVTTSLKVGTDRRGSWIRIASVCTDVVARPDKCSSTFTW